MGSFSSPKARYYFSRACGFHRGVMPDHNCSNPAACKRTLEAAYIAETEDRGI